MLNRKTLAGTGWIGWRNWPDSKTRRGSAPPSNIRKERLYLTHKRRRGRGTAKKWPKFSTSVRARCLRPWLSGEVRDIDGECEDRWSWVRGSPVHHGNQRPQTAAPAPKLKTSPTLRASLLACPPDASPIHPIKEFVTDRSPTRLVRQRTLDEWGNQCASSRSPFSSPGPQQAESQRFPHAG